MTTNQPLPDLQPALSYNNRRIILPQTSAEPRPSSLPVDTSMIDWDRMEVDMGNVWGDIDEEEGWDVVDDGVYDAKRYEEAYYQLINATKNHFLAYPDFGVLPSDRPFYKILGCRYNNPNREGHGCGRCFVCRKIFAGKTRKKVSELKKRMFNPASHAYYFITLSLPATMPDWAMAVTGKWRNFGELFYATPKIFSEGYESKFPLNRILHDFKREAMLSVLDCCAGKEIGLLVSLHLVDDFFRFFPHVHILLCDTALKTDALPRQFDKNGRMIGLDDAWCSLADGKPKKFFALETGWRIRTRWAERQGKLVGRLLQAFKPCLAPSLVTRNVLYNVLHQASPADIDGMADWVKTEVSGDKAVVKSTLIDYNAQTGEDDREGGCDNVMSYSLSNRPKRLRFALKEKGCPVAQTLNDEGVWRQLGDDSEVYRRCAQLHSASRLRTAETYGLFSGSWGGGKGRRKMLRDAMV